MQGIGVTLITVFQMIAQGCQKPRTPGVHIYVMGSYTNTWQRSQNVIIS